jgi:hypothetical protein
MDTLESAEDKKIILSVEVSAFLTKTAVTMFRYLADGADKL